MVTQGVDHCVVIDPYVEESSRVWEGADGELLIPLLCVSSSLECDLNEVTAVSSAHGTALDTGNPQEDFHQ
jgi:hypothetical protein